MDDVGPEPLNEPDKPAAEIYEEEDGKTKKKLESQYKKLLKEEKKRLKMEKRNDSREAAQHQKLEKRGHRFTTA